MAEERGRTPALSAEQWAFLRKGLEVQVELVRMEDAKYGLEVREERALDDDVVLLETDADRKAVAAACLHDQPFGFTHQDLERLRAAAFTTFDRDPSEPFANPLLAEAMRDLADRIEALLPPREDQP